MPEIMSEAASETTPIGAASSSAPVKESDLPNAQMSVFVSADDLPLHCPMPGKRLWDSHPKVYLPIENSRKEICPYCGTVYRLRDATERGSFAAARVGD